MKKSKSFLDHAFLNAHLVFLSTFLISLSILEYMDLIVKIPKLLELILPLTIALLAFLALLSLHRLEKPGRTESSPEVTEKNRDKDITKELAKIGKVTLFFIFICLPLFIFSSSDHNELLKHEFTIQFDRLIVSAIVAFLAYLFLSASKSYLENT